MKRIARFKPLTADLRDKIERMLELNEAHRESIQSGDNSFYQDGRHAAMIELGTEVHAALNIRPWNDADAMLREALEAAQ